MQKCQDDCCRDHQDERKDSLLEARLAVCLCFSSCLLAPCFTVRMYSIPYANIIGTCVLPNITTASIRLLSPLPRDHASSSSSSSSLSVSSSPSSSSPSSFSSSQPLLLLPRVSFPPYADLIHSFLFRIVSACRDDWAWLMAQIRDLYDELDPTQKGKIETEVCKTDRQTTKSSFLQSSVSHMLSVLFWHHLVRYLPACVRPVTPSFPSLASLFHSADLSFLPFVSSILSSPLRLTWLQPCIPGSIIPA